ncbi:MAG: hypothetical protein LC750_16735 [Actinobacteria bacterium]|nr:hypothetical protein [Actinomycetota bacterium]
MPQGKFRVFFTDKSYEDVDATDRNDAKTKAATVRIKDVDPGGRLDRAELASHARVKIARVAEHNVDDITAAIVLLVAGAALLADLLHPIGAGRHVGAGVLQLIGASGTAISATISALAAVTGDSLTIPFFSDAKKAWLLQLWTDVQVAGTVRVRSGKWHDDVQGIRYKTIISDLRPLLPFGMRQPIYSGDTLHVDLAGSAVAGDIEYVVMLMYYEELSSQSAKMITYEQLEARRVNMITAENTIATGTTAAWTGAEAINSEIDQFHTRTEYALVGYTVDVEASAVAWRGPDFANVRCGGPGDETAREVTANWFAMLARATGLACIPVLSGDNKAATVVETLQDENGADTTLSSILAELRPQ